VDNKVKLPFRTLHIDHLPLSVTFRTICKYKKRKGEKAKLDDGASFNKIDRRQLRGCVQALEKHELSAGEVGALIPAEETLLQKALEIKEAFKAIDLQMPLDGSVAMSTLYGAIASVLPVRGDTEETCKRAYIRPATWEIIKERETLLHACLGMELKPEELTRLQEGYNFDGGCHLGGHPSCLDTLRRGNHSPAVDSRYRMCGARTCKTIFQCWSLHLAYTKKHRERNQMLWIDKLEWLRETIAKATKASQKWGLERALPDCELVGAQSPGGETPS
jgi:hypothetical protein